MARDFDDEEPRLDLLGDPWTPPRDPRGRKRHKRSAQVAEKIGFLRAAGLTGEQIATRTGLSEPTLRKYYLRELTDGATLARAVLLEAIVEKALGGNVAAAKVMLAEFAKGSAAVPIAPRKGAEPKPDRVEQLGKKAALERDAQTAHKGTEWGDLLKH